MKTINRLDRDNLSTVQAAIAAALAEVGQQYGLRFDLDGVRFSSGEAHGKLTMTVLQPSESDRPQQFPAGGVNGVTNADIGKIVTFGNGDYRIEGYNPAKRSRCIVLSRVSDGKSGYTANPQQIAAVLGRDTGAATGPNPNVYPGDWEYHQGEDFDQYRERTDKMLEAIPKDRLISFPIADGHALYYVVSLKPLRLQHIPYGDAYQIPAPMMRGLRAADVQRLIEQEKAIARLFKGNK